MDAEKPTADAGKSTCETVVKDDLLHSDFVHLQPILEDVRSNSSYNYFLNTIISFFN